jgi:predicted site-specific integrase-resolvase
MPNDNTALFRWKAAEPDNKSYRFSSHDQKNDLISHKNKLLNFAKNNNYLNIISITDLGSGLNYKKPGLKKLLHLIF